MNYCLTTSLSGLASWGSDYLGGLALAEDDYYSANARRKSMPPRDSSGGSRDEAEANGLRVEARLQVLSLKMSNPEAFARLDLDLQLGALLRRERLLHDPGAFLPRLEEALARLPAAPDHGGPSGVVSLLERGRQPPEPIPIVYGTGDEVTANQRAVFARLVQEETSVERMLLREISLHYLQEADYLAEVVFGRRLGDVSYLPRDPTEENLRRLALIREVHVAPSTNRLAIVLQLPYLIDFEHGSSCVALVDGFDYIHFGDVGDLVWVV